MKNKKSKWDSILEEYITTDNLSILSLSEKYNVAPGAIYERAKKERWDVVRALSRKTTLITKTGALKFLASQLKKMRQNATKENEEKKTTIEREENQNNTSVL